ncbi:MAG: hypothetical protein FWC75_03865 [Oscillospiraceae bacterium]|nr:hypothetical protein [Oscillospiraceae bacterium]
MPTKQELYNARRKRVDDVKALKVPDRVPLAPKLGFFYGSAYGIPSYASLTDVKNSIPGIQAYLEEFDPDIVWPPAVYPSLAAKALGSEFIKFPGYEDGIPLNDSFQILDGEYMSSDEYEEFVFDPTHFILSKWLPRRNKNLAGLAKVNLQNPIEFGLYASTVPFCDPEVKQAFEALALSGKHSLDWLMGGGACAQVIEDAGFVLGPQVGTTCPFDMLADTFRGMIPAIMDIHECPDELLAAVNTMQGIMLRNALGAAIAMKKEFFLIPLHMGVDEFMSPENYAKFYWPGLKALIMACIDNGITPYVFTEGNYNTRLEQLCDVPPGKVVYMFEKVDMKRAKETVGQVACICGNLPTATLMYSTPDKIADETKKLLDICAPGGGFMMDVSIPVDRCPKENLHAMFDTVHKYGHY